MAQVIARLSRMVTRWTGSPFGFFVGLILVIVWLGSGPLFGWSDSHSLFINTTTTICTFLMLFLIQNTQNRDGAAIQAKLDEIIRTSKAQNRYIGIEGLTEPELDDLRKRCADNACAK